MTNPSDEDPKAPAVDLVILREATGGDRDLMQELAELYVGDADLQIRALGDALQIKRVIDQVTREFERVRLALADLR